MKEALEKVLRNDFWHLICHRSELPASQDFLRMRLLGEDIVVYNDNGTLTVFDNLCPHRGTRFFVESYGNAPALCPYHGWRYRNGEILVSRKEQFASCDLSAAKLKTLHTAWCGDFLFAGIRPRMALEEQLSGLAPLLENISREIHYRHDLNEQAFECHWRIALENALEPYHVDLVHPSTLGSLRLTEGRDEFFGNNSIWWSEVASDRARRGLDILGRFFSLNYQYKGYVSIFIFPFSMLSSTFGYSYALQHYFPTAHLDNTTFSSRLLIARARDATNAAELTSFFDSTAQLNRRVFEEDYRICQRVSEKALDWERPAFFGRSEKKVAHFREKCTELVRAF